MVDESKQDGIRRKVPGIASTECFKKLLCILLFQRISDHFLYLINSLNLYGSFLTAMAIFDIAKDLLFIYKHENAETLQQFQQIFRVILFNLENESDAKVCWNDFYFHLDRKVALARLSFSEDNKMINQYLFIMSK